MVYKYRGNVAEDAETILENAKAQAEAIILKAQEKATRIVTQARRDGMLIREKAHDQGMALADREYATPEEKEADRIKAKKAILTPFIESRIRAAAWEAGNIKAKDIRPRHRVENVEHLLSAGCGKGEAIRRAGFPSEQAFIRAAYRYGRKDLVAYFNHNERQEQAA
jgi:hypothetical protein